MRYIACWGDDSWRDIGRGGDGSKGVLVSIPPSGVPWPRVRHNGKRLRSLALYEQGATWTRLDVLIECVIWMNGPNIWATLTTTVCTWSDSHDAFSIWSLSHPTTVWSQPRALLEESKIPGVYRAKDTDAHVSPLRLFCAMPHDDPRETEPGCGEGMVLGPIATLKLEWSTMFVSKQTDHSNSSTSRCFPERFRHEERGKSPFWSAPE